MKLYTEEQMKEAIKIALHRFGIGGIEDTIEVVASKFTPIELASDEEIEQEMEVNWLYPDDVYPDDVAYLDGAKWMRDKIQGGNK